MSKTQIQVALDTLDFNATLAIAEQVAPYVDIFEIGTPCVKRNGLKVIEAIREKFPNHRVLADLKTMDAGEYESAPFYAAGADICTVLGVSGAATIAGVVKAASAHNAEVQVDLINVEDKVSCAQISIDVGVDIIGIHTGLDAQAAGQTPFSDLAKIMNLGLDAKISVAGGITEKTAEEVVQNGAHIIVAGAAIYGAKSPKVAAAAIRQSISLVAA